MKTKHVVIAVLILLIGGAAVFLASRRSDIRVAISRVEGDASSRPSEFSSDGWPRQSMDLRPAVEEPEGPITATAQITRGDKSVIEARSLDGEFARILVEPNEVLTIRLALSGFDPNREVRVDADNGGSLNRRLGPLTLPPNQDGNTLEFQYAAGGHRGKYTLYVRQGQRREFMEFWVGPEPPRGQPGPEREFNPDRT